MKYLLGAILISLAGSVVVVGGNDLDVASIFDTTKEVASEANLHQVRTALEIYYLEEGHYPKTNSGENLIELLYNNDYISDKPAPFTSFDYKAVNSGQDYTLELVL